MNRWKIIGVSTLLSFAGILGTTLAADSGGSTGGPITLENPLGSQSFLDIVTAIWSALFTLSIPVCSIMVLVGGYYIMTAAGNEERLKTGRRTITYAVVGFAVILLSYGVVSVIRQLVGV